MIFQKVNADSIYHNWYHTEIKNEELGILINLGRYADSKCIA